MTLLSALASPVKSRESSGAAPVSGGSDPPLDHGGGGGGGEWVLLTTAGNSVLAHLIQGRLAQEGISCVLDDFDPSPGAWLKPFGDPMAPVRIFVRRRNFSQASMLLHEVEHKPPDPACEGPRVVRTMWWLTIVAVVVLTLVTLFQMFSGRSLVYPDSVHIGRVQAAGSFSR